jgi:hypothetical protein
LQRIRCFSQRKGDRGDGQKTRHSGFRLRSRLRHARLPVHKINESSLNTDGRRSVDMPSMPFPSTSPSPANFSMRGFAPFLRWQAPERPRAMSYRRGADGRCTVFHLEFHDCRRPDCGNPLVDKAEFKERLYDAHILDRGLQADFPRKRENPARRWVPTDSGGGSHGCRKENELFENERILPLRIRRGIRLIFGCQGLYRALKGNVVRRRRFRRRGGDFTLRRRSPRSLGFPNRHGCPASSHLV